MLGGGGGGLSASASSAATSGAATGGNLGIQIQGITTGNAANGQTSGQGGAQNNSLLYIVIAVAAVLGVILLRR